MTFLGELGSENDFETAAADTTAVTTAVATAPLARLCFCASAFGRFGGLVCYISIGFERCWALSVSGQHVSRISLMHFCFSR